MNESRLLPVFSATLFTSAFLIFAVQPMASKMLLPMLGGSPSVWNTAMVFFQAMLLAGYAYAHFVARFLPLKAQPFLHVALLIGFMIFLPFALPADTAPPEGSGQAFWQLGIMLACVGGPFFILAASAPLFQHWFASSGHEDAENPYFLYAVSNIGSMVALLGYPFVIEPALRLGEQALNWFGGYILLTILTVLCGYLIRNGKRPVQPLAMAPDQQKVTWAIRFIWIFLAFVPSSLMLGVTTMITTDLATAPLFWIIPLALYLTTFIIAFSRMPIISLPLARELSSYALALVVLIFMMSGFLTLIIPMVIIHLFAFFICAQLCHSELALARPSTSHLTEYFLLISFGGVLGGIFNALIAPKIFPVPLEYSLSLACAALVILAGSSETRIVSTAFNVLHDKRRRVKILAADFLILIVGIALCIGTFMLKKDFTQVLGALSIFFFLFIIIQNKPVFVITLVCALVLFQPGLWDMKMTMMNLQRNYFGVLKVYQKADTHFFYHGTTLHGAQDQDDKNKLYPLTYYSQGGPASDIFNYMTKRGGNQEVAALGLGVGSITCYKSPGRHFDFYEIDQDVVKIAQNPKYFSYLSGCGSPYDVILGDARLKLAQSPKKYDLIFIDTFSSDNIPVHIITKEAFEVYLAKLATEGIIAINISNRYLDLRPVLNAMGRDLGLTVYFKLHAVQKVKGEVSQYYTDSLYAIIARKPETIATFAEDHGWAPRTKHGDIKAWTDDYADIVSSFVFLQ